ncbi:immunoglobulin lambda-1 light chain-like [Chanos chanos]|uniref:immunoglobulin lambda-1 light chain-like n=1 Tax=Chanos chanos TaxID=29144 RepID=UPI0011F0EBA3|nr:immunoglobulin lambda-1 light chain-like [Chanos chanos]
MTLYTVPVIGLILTLPGLEGLVLTQEKFMSANVGQNVKFLCSPSTSSWSITWYQQKPGEAPKFLLRDSTRASGLPSRFTYSESGSLEYLHINGMQAEDEGVYYCACHNCEGSGYIGGGTKLSIARSPSPPQLVLLAPSHSALSGEQASVVCLAKDFHPDQVTFSWLEDGSAMADSEFQTAESLHQSDGTFSQSSVLKVSSERWRSGHTYTCQLSHSALSTPLSKSVGQGQCSS